ncbi:hypothetical protein AVEN_67953-1 [Araneus ventricosus]|uniref:Uncharacterized protein n=1 Tax=Araneus ventricosus TaxID=182803 RepID=A0A4Y2Q9Y1_ARAVE|nr:hypothetical protein AVEN_67953-1 [Araneus ventricosus]
MPTGGNASAKKQEFCDASIERIPLSPSADLRVYSVPRLRRRHFPRTSTAGKSDSPSFSSEINPYTIVLGGATSCCPSGVPDGFGYDGNSNCILKIDRVCGSAAH